jgi:hypothetical protein
MRRTARLAPLAALAVLAALWLPACGGSDEGGATSRAAAPALAERLPPANALPGLTAGDVVRLPTAEEWVDALADEGDPAKPAAVRRLRAAGFRSGVLRDDRRGGARPVLVRTTVARLGSPRAARAEAAGSVAGVARSGDDRGSAVTVPGVPGAQGTEIAVRAAGRRIRILFVSFADGPYLYGYQAISLAGGGSSRAGVLAAARAAYERWRGVP